MRKSTALGFALCGTLLVILLFIAGRMLYIKFYHQSFTDIAGKGVQASLMLSENDTSLPAVTDENRSLPIPTCSAATPIRPIRIFSSPAMIS